MPKVIYTYKIRGVGVVGLSLFFVFVFGIRDSQKSKPATYVPPTLPKTEDRGDSRFRGDRVPWNPIYRVTASSLLLLLISYFLLFYPTRLLFLLSLLPTSLLAAMSYLVSGSMEVLYTLLCIWTFLVVWLLTCFYYYYFSFLILKPFQSFHLTLSVSKNFCLFFK